jgi:hypothetical protein
MSYIRMNREVCNVRDAVIVQNILENMRRLAGMRWAVTYVDPECPFANKLWHLGYHAMPGKVYYRQL